MEYLLERQRKQANLCQSLDSSIEYTKSALRTQEQERDIEYKFLNVLNILVEVEDEKAGINSKG